MSWRKISPALFIGIILFMFFITPVPTPCETVSLELIDAFATLPGESARVGYFTEGQQINLLFIYDVGTDSDETARFTWDVYDRHGNLAFSGERDLGCNDGENSSIITDAIPGDLGAGTQIYQVYASVSIGGLKDDIEFEVRIESPQAWPGVMIEDVRLTPREDDSPIASDMRDAAIPYTLEIDFRAENIISWAHAEIRWLGITSDGFVLDRGLGTTNVDEGFNNFDVESYIARPPYGATPEADFSVQVLVYDQFDSVTFPIYSLPISLVELRSSSGDENASDFSIGEAYLLTGDGARTSYFSQDETITARLLTGGIVPENTTIVMHLEGGPDISTQEFMTRLDSGAEIPVIDYDLPSDVVYTPGSYEFIWSVYVGDTLLAERRVSLTITDRMGIEVPTIIDLPGGATFTVPIPWEVNIESEVGLYATIVTPSGVVCRLLGHALDEPLRVELLADLFETNVQLSGIPPGATPLTSEEAQSEGEWESVRRAYLGNGKVYINDYWLFRTIDGGYQFLASTSSAEEDMVTETYEASDAIRQGINLGL